MNGFRVLYPVQLVLMYRGSQSPGERAERINILRKLAQFMSHHVLGDSHVVVDLAIVYLELETDKVGEDGGRSCLGSDGGDLLAWLGANDGKASNLGNKSESSQLGKIVLKSETAKEDERSYGTICGPVSVNVSSCNGWTGLCTKLMRRCRNAPNRAKLCVMRVFHLSTLSDS